MLGPPGAGKIGTCVGLLLFAAPGATTDCPLADSHCGAAIGDRACATPKLAERFGPRVTDFAVDNGHRAHDPEPYLNSAATGHAVAAGLARTAR